MCAGIVWTLGQLAQRVGGQLKGDPDAQVSRVAPLRTAQSGDISFLTQPRYRKQLAATRATAVILAASDVESCPVAALVVDNPPVAYARIAVLLNPAPCQQGIHPAAVVSPASRIHPSAWIGPLCVIEEGVEIGARTSIGPGCMVGRNSRIDEDSILLAQVTLCPDSQIGRRVLIHPGVVIGSDGFGLANDNGVWVKIPQLGRVRIGDDVEIGANTTIDRGALDDTVIEEGVKLDNQIQVAHNVRIGTHTAIAACVGIAGSTTIGKRCTIAGGVGINGHIEIADDVHITGMTMVTKSILQPGVYSSGIPVEPNAVWKKNVARFRRLEGIERRLRALEQDGDEAAPQT